MGDTTHVRVYEADKEWLNEEFEAGSMASKIGRVIERYKTEEKQ